MLIILGMPHWISFLIYHTRNLQFHIWNIPFHFFFETDFLPVVKKFIKSYLGQKFQVSWQFTHFPSDEISSNLIRNNWGASSIITKKSTASPGAADRTTTMAFDEGKNSLETHQIDLTWWVGSLCKNSLLDCCSWIV